MKKYLDYDGAKVLIDQALEEFAPIDHKHNVDDIEGYVGGDSTQSDWNQSDETAPDYVKNRPFYELDERTETVVVENKTISATESRITFSDFYPSSGVTYKIIWDDVEYICVAEQRGQSVGLGNWNLVTIGDTNEPFFIYEAAGYGQYIYFTSDQIGSEHTYSVYQIEGDITVVKLDEKYIPDTIARVTDVETEIANLVNSAPETLDTIGELATAFKDNSDMIEILNAAVTNKADKKDVVQADWNENDETSMAYVKNRIGGYTVDDTEVIFIDNEEFDFTENNSMMFTLSPETLDVLQLGKSVIVIFNDVEYICTVKQASPYGIPCRYIGNFTIFNTSAGAEDTGEPFVFHKDPFNNADKWSLKTKENNKFTITISWIGLNTVKIPLQMVETVGKKYKSWSSGEVFSDYVNNIASGDYSHAEGHSTKALGAYSHSEGYLTKALETCSHAEGTDSIASGQYSHAEGGGSTASGMSSHSEGTSTASGTCAHAEGSYTTALGNHSHAEGMSGNRASDHITAEATDEEIISAHYNNKFTLAKGDGSHAEGRNCLALGDFSHAEGYETESIGSYSHAEGYWTDTIGHNSHAEGCCTSAIGEHQHVQGRFNIRDTENKYAHIVGNGEDEDNKSNAHTLDWNGNGWYAGSLYVGGTSQDDAVRVATLDDIAKYNQITMVDEDNGYDYVVAMKNGSLVSYCACTSIAITTLPSKTEYTSGDVFDPTDMVVTATCQDGNTREITNYTYTETVTASPVVVSYVERGITYTAEVTVTIV